MKIIFIFSFDHIKRRLKKCLSTRHNLEILKEVDKGFSRKSLLLLCVEFFRTFFLTSINNNRKIKSICPNLISINFKFCEILVLLIEIKIHGNFRNH